MTIQYNFDKVIDRRNNDSIKWEVYGEDVLPMWVADMDFISPEPVIRALRERIDHGIFGYPAGIINPEKETPELHGVIIDRLAKLYNWEVQVEDIILLPGVVPGFNLALQTFAKPSEAVLFQTPVYPPILHSAEITGIQHQEMELTLNSDGSYNVDWQVFEDSITPNTKTFILCNPHNPVGRVFTKEELKNFAEICLKNEVLIISDEIHADLIFEPHHHTPIAAIDPEVAQNTITLIAPSKTYNIAGLQFSAAIIQNPTLREEMNKAKDVLLHWVNSLGMAAAQAAYQEGQEWLDQVLVYMQANRDYLHQYLQENMPEIKMAVPEGTYLAWLDCRNAGIEGNPHQFFLEKGKVAFNDGETFGKGGEGFVRLNFGCPRSLLTEGLQRMQTALNQQR
jgi:cystathionine beta-lyase